MLQSAAARSRTITAVDTAMAQDNDSPKREANSAEPKARAPIAACGCSPLTTSLEPDALSQFLTQSFRRRSEEIDGTACRHDTGHVSHVGD